jgi:hypothetical protein
MKGLDPSLSPAKEDTSCRTLHLEMAIVEQSADTGECFDGPNPCAFDKYGIQLVRAGLSGNDGFDALA